MRNVCPSLDIAERGAQALYTEYTPKTWPSIEKSPLSHMRCVDWPDISSLSSNLVADTIGQESSLGLFTSSLEYCLYNVDFNVVVELCICRLT